MPVLFNFHEVKIDNQSGYEFLYQTPISDLKLHYTVNPLYKLGFVTVYDVRLGSNRGMGIGYAFVAGSAQVKYQHNYLLYMRPKMASKNKIQLAKRGGHLELKYTLTNIKIFVYDNLVFITRSDVDDTIIRRLNNDL